MCVETEMSWIFFAVLCFIFLSGIDSIVSNDFQFTFINSDHSTVKLRPSLWKGSETSGFEFHLKVNRENGTAITVFNTNGDVLQVKIVSDHFILSHHQHNQQIPPTIHSTVLLDEWNTIKFESDEENKKNVLFLFINSNKKQLNGTSFSQWKEVWIGAHEGRDNEKASKRCVGRNQICIILPQK